MSGEHWISTYTGRRFDLIDPQPETICIRDIVQGLSHCCRFTGQVSRFYSVAEHSVNVAFLLPDHLRMIGLIHDAAEAYYGDVNTVLKSLLPDYKALEKRAQAVIYDKYIGRAPDPDECLALKRMDLRMLGAEARVLLAEGGADWRCLDGVEIPDVPVIGQRPDVARTAWLREWRLAGGNVE